MSWAQNHMSYGQKWQLVILSDEKKGGIWMVRWLIFELAWFVEVNMFFQSHSRRGEESVMVWASFWCNEQLSLTFNRNRQISQHYTKTLEENLPFVEFQGGPQWNFCKITLRFTLETKLNLGLIIRISKFLTGQHVARI